MCGFLRCLDRTRYSRPKNKITDALFAILANGPIERITVAEVCPKAGVDRSTFYSHFAGIYDVRNRYDEKLLNEIDAVISQIMEEWCLQTITVQRHSFPRYARTSQRN